mmetsp:Transcript_20763/g.45423  ORF Transcript_20763/g.45423 Transcript_20763/m.45423 type:complete len:359 (-) Transcript_20763:595-1671(-)
MPASLHQLCNSSLHPSPSQSPNSSHGTHELLSTRCLCSQLHHPYCRQWRYIGPQQQRQLLLLLPLPGRADHQLPVRGLVSSTATPPCPCVGAPARDRGCITLVTGLAPAKAQPVLDVGGDGVCCVPALLLLPRPPRRLLAVTDLIGVRHEGDGGTQLVHAAGRLTRNGRLDDGTNYVPLIPVEQCLPVPLHVVVHARVQHQPEVGKGEGRTLVGHAAVSPVEAHVAEAQAPPLGPCPPRCRDAAGLLGSWHAAARHGAACPDSSKTLPASCCRGMPACMVVLAVHCAVPHRLPGVHHVRGDCSGAGPGPGKDEAGHGALHEAPAQVAIRDAGTLCCSQCAAQLPSSGAGSCRAHIHRR